MHRVNRVIVGSVNPVKTAAVEAATRKFPYLSSAVVLGRDVSSQVSEQPMTFPETIAGALNRAKGAFALDGSIGVGIESGLMSVPGTQTGLLDTCVCVIFDGEALYTGMAPGFECPPNVIAMVRERRCDLDAAFHELGYTEDPKSGLSHGVINIVTNGRMSRQKYTEIAVIMALSSYEMMWRQRG